jgi:predicted transcriptional regulator
MPRERPSLSKSELEIARIVWELGEASVRQVHEALPADRQVDFWTVQTFLRRLKEKGYLKARRVGQGNVYSPAVQPQRVIRELMDDFVERLFDGEVVPLFQHLVESRGLSDEEIQQLQGHLNELKAKKK